LAMSEEEQAPSKCSRHGCYEFVVARPCCPSKAACQESDGFCATPWKKPPLERPLLDAGGLTGEVCCPTKSPMNPRQQCCSVFCMLLVIYILFGSIAQFVCFHWATMKCGGGSPADDYIFPGGGNSNFGGAEFNLLPEYGSLVEQDHTMWGMKFGVLSKEGSDLIGAWYRTGGPFFSTYTYQDTDNSPPTVYMRASIQSIIFGYCDDYAMRCDGKGDSLRLSEGGSYLSNRIRHLFAMNQGSTFKVWSGGKVIASAEETYHGIKSITFKNVSGSQAKFASATIDGLPFKIEGKDHVRWRFTNSPNQSIPYYQTSAMSTLYAFRIWSSTAEVTATNRKNNGGPAFLAEGNLNVEEEETKSNQDVDELHE